MAGQLTIDTLRASSGVLATQNGMTGIAKAWVQFVGGTSPSINGSFNVSSVTYVATGVYQINFTTAMSNSNYAPQACYAINAGTAYSAGCGLFWNNSATTAPTTSSFYFVTAGITSGPYNPSYVSVVVFGA